MPIVLVPLALPAGPSWNFSDQPGSVGGHTHPGPASEIQPPSDCAEKCAQKAGASCPLAHSQCASKGTLCCQPLSYQPWLHGACDPSAVAGALGSCHRQLSAMSVTCITLAPGRLLLPLSPRWLAMLCCCPGATRPMSPPCLPQLLPDEQCWMCIYGRARGQPCTPHFLHLCSALYLQLPAWVSGPAVQALLPCQSTQPKCVPFLCRWREQRRF